MSKGGTNASRLWSREELQEGILLYRGVKTDIGVLEAAYIGPCGVFIWLAHCDAPASAHDALRELLQVPQVYLYTDDEGLYDPRTGQFRGPVPDDSLPDLISSLVAGDQALSKYSSWDIERMGERLIRADAHCRGSYRSADGILYIRHGKGFREVSPKNSETVFFTALFGGVFGIHRFLLGKYASGLLYLFTGGLFLTGWTIDLLFLFLGIMKDKKGKILYPLIERPKKALMLPVGFIFSAFLLMGGLGLFQSLTSSFQLQVSQVIQDNSSTLADFMYRLLGNL